MALIAPKPEPSRYARKLNGDEDKILGYDDGEWPSSERPKDYYQPFTLTGDPDIDEMDEPDIAEALPPNTF